MSYASTAIQCQQDLNTLLFADSQGRLSLSICDNLSPQSYHPMGSYNKRSPLCAQSALPGARRSSSKRMGTNPETSGERVSGCLKDLPQELRLPSKAPGNQLGVIHSSPFGRDKSLDIKEHRQNRLRQMQSPFTRKTK